MNDLKSVLRSATVMFLFVGLVGIWVGGCEGRETQEQTVERLIKRLGHKKANVRANAAGALGRIGKDAVPALIEALKDQDVGVRWNAAGALKKIGTPFRLFIINSPNRQFPNGQFHYSAHTDLVNVSAYYCCD